ncbi:cytochrome P450 [Nonomuraea sp. KC401]|uniref:cytochrome P450 n=1 Tax=unclassified Nonomuraea TaxID=2593643 RepID=UPI0010FEF98B|nr:MULTISPECIES: cytochrome P450 [unclassified Nonomuraea]NBE98575.1 cytochrome P450 [Nonomuraea sp. K271]TLF60544.1 cytochrome P450 [Nonomuraea sp. KC401]
MTENAALSGYPDHADAVPLHGPALDEDPDELYQRLRREHGTVVPVLLDDGVPAWFVIGYRELHHVFGMPHLFGRDSRRWNVWAHVPADGPLMATFRWQPTVLFAEGAERQRRTGAIGDAMDGVDRTELAMLAEQVSDRLIDGFAGDGEADLVTQYARRIPAQVIARLMGMPEADMDDVVTNVNVVLDATSETFAAYTWLRDRMCTLMAAKREVPGDDIASRLIAHPAELSDEEADLDLGVMLVVANTPTAGWIGNTLRLMLVNDRFSITLQGGRSSVGQAMNEVLWRDPPLRTAPGRWATQDCELGGRRIRKGDLLVLGLAAANADPRVQPADEYEPGANRAHMSFGHGEYSCPYPAPELGEVIAEAAVEVLLDRLPDVDLAVSPDALRWRRSLWMRNLETLPVVFSPTAPRPASWDAG